jgi:DNA-binding MarR family transcriptional regulator/GNAT superfamily N-acetyltransferase
MAKTERPERVEAVRRFNRFYTRQIGILRESYLRSPFTLSEVRILYELAHHEGTTATHLRRELGLDAGYLSRVLSTFQTRGLVRRRPADEDRRQHLLTLTDRGQRAFAALNAASKAEIEAMLARLAAPDQTRLVQSMRTIHDLLGAPAEHRASYILRPLQPGDLGWIVHRHGVLYAREYGWNEQFEALVAEIVAEFVQRLDRKRERGWIAERDGENVGSVLLVRHPKRKQVAKLRLLLVEPSARGLGIGRRLVHECSRFARQVGYRRITLWTNSVLTAARHLYEEEGYRLVDEAPHESFGKKLLGQTWELEL